MLELFHMLIRKYYLFDSDLQDMHSHAPHIHNVPNCCKMCRGFGKSPWASEIHETHNVTYKLQTPNTKNENKRLLLLELKVGQGFAIGIAIFPTFCVI